MESDTLRESQMRNIEEGVYFEEVTRPLEREFLDAVARSMCPIAYAANDILVEAFKYAAVANFSKEDIIKMLDGYEPDSNLTSYLAYAIKVNREEVYGGRFDLDNR
ncbi:MAG: hypothetical protein KDJ38_02345 [Gammaproteobacteria bacterium]|nr:hypothetical protein [Gammaproteobacteria bacterium]